MPVLAGNLPHVTVVQADATRRTVLEEERVGSADVFVACTGEDENNIMAGVEAREIGASKIMAIVGRPDYADIVGRLGIDVAVSPRDVMAKQVLSFLQSGPVVARMPLPGGNISVYEIEVEADSPATTRFGHAAVAQPMPDRGGDAGRIRDGSRGGRSPARRRHGHRLDRR
jgi:trk system potassium uptake protein